jgi:phage shock protein A
LEQAAAQQTAVDQLGANVRMLEAKISEAKTKKVGGALQLWGLMWGW